MKRYLYILIALIMTLTIILSSCYKNDEPKVTNQPTLTNAPTTSATDKISLSPITFIFTEDTENDYLSLYHQLAYIRMEDAGYSIKNIYVENTDDLSTMFSNIETDGTEYVIAASDALIEQSINYKENSNSDLIFIQYGDYYSDVIFTYREKLYEYYYLSGAALCSESTSKIAGFIAASPDEATIRCINAFALGMKSVDENAVVIVSWAENANDESHIAQLIDTLSYQKCDVYAYHMPGDMVEKVADKLGTAYMTMSTHTMLNSGNRLIIKPVVELDKYYSEIINTNKQPLSNEFKYLGIAEGIVSYQLSDTVSPETKMYINDAYQNIANGYNIFTGPIYNELGLVVPNDTELPEGDVLDMLWFVDNVVGELPAG